MLTIHPSEYIGGGGGEDHSGDGPGEDGDGWPYSKLSDHGRTPKPLIIYIIVLAAVHLYGRT